MRHFFDTYVKPEAQAHELTDKRPTVDLIKKMGAAPWFIQQMRLGPGKHLHGLNLPGGIKGEEFDYFHELIINQEVGRIGARGKVLLSPALVLADPCLEGYADGLQGGMVIGLPPVMNFGSPELRQKIVGPVLAGEKFISLAISEAFAGSVSINIVHL
jgi:alkylation response protein AidB-like acyl-CoA dehydrogenase